MLHILIDSTEFKRDPSFSKPELSRLYALGKHNLATLHIPYIVYGECVSATVEKLTSGVKKAAKEVGAMPRRGLHVDETATVEQIINSVKELESSVGDSVKRAWKQYIEESNSLLYGINAHSTEAVFEAYFTAGVPFPSLKSRKDIPDAFIYHQALEISQGVELIVITNDSNLRNKLNDQANITGLSSFDELYADARYSLVAEQLVESEAEANKKAILIDQLDRIRESIKEQVEELYNVSLDNGLTLTNESEVVVNLFQDVEVEIKEEDIESYGDGFVIPIDVNAYAEVEYYMYYGDFIVANLERVISEEVNGHTVLVTQSLSVKGKRDYVVDLIEIEEGEDVQVIFDEFDELLLD